MKREYQNNFILSCWLPAEFDKALVRCNECRYMQNREGVCYCTLYQTYKVGAGFCDQGEREDETNEE